MNSWLSYKFTKSSWVEIRKINGKVSKTMEGEFKKVKKRGKASLTSDSVDSKNLISSKIFRRN